MKFIAVILLLALFAVAIAEKQPADVEKIEPVNQEAENAARDKRGVVGLVGGAYTAPVAYAAYNAPVAYTAGYSLPYAYASAYRTYPYYYNSYIYG